MNALKWINTIAFAIMVAVNIAANVIPIGGNTTGDVSLMYQNLFTPAPVTFAIWGVIYFFMLLFVLFQMGCIGSVNVSTSIRKSIGISFAISCAINVAWIFTWHMRMIEVSTGLIVLLLLCLIYITRKIDKVRGSTGSFVMVNLGFDIYFGWIIAATIANISVLLTKLKWGGWGISPVTWTVLILLVGSAIGAAVVIIDGRYFSGAALIWAYIGIIIKHLMRTGYNGEYMAVVYAACGGIIIVIGAILCRLFKPKKKLGAAVNNG